MALSILIPWAPSGMPDRERSFCWLQERYAALMPDAEVIIDRPDHIGDPGSFNRPMAINRAAARARGDFFAIIDADTWVDLEWIREAIHHITMKAHSRTWALARTYARIGPEGTLANLEREPDLPLITSDITETSDFSWASAPLMSRSAFRAVGGYDERFEGWGWDDIAFGIKMDTLWGPHTRIRGSVFHLHHERPPENHYGGPHAERQRLLAEEYIKAAGDPDAVREVMGY